MSRRSSPSFAAGGVNDCAWDSDYIYPPPRFGWRCFHCNEHFQVHEVREAQRHFGLTPKDIPMCQMEETSNE